MLQFNKSEATNTNAVYLDTVNTGSGYYDDLRIQYSQSYDRSNGIFTVTALSTPNQYRNWLTLSNLGSVVPSPSGQYDIKLYTATTTPGEAVIWGQYSVTWTAASQNWGTVSGSEGGKILGDLLYSDRAWVSGSNESSITTYVSSNQDGAYITYNG